MSVIERVEMLARLSILRGLGFAALAVATAMVGFIFDPAQAFRVGGILTGIVAAVIAIKGMTAPRRPYKRTEVWLMLDRHVDLPADKAQQVIGGILHRLYIRYAERVAGVAIGMYLIAIVTPSGPGLG